MRMRDPAGLFEATVEGRISIFPYQLEIHYPDGESITIHDPYSFMPTLGDLDLHLWGEQKDDRAYDKLGAHVREMAASAACRSRCGRPTRAASAWSAISTDGTGAST